MRTVLTVGRLDKSREGALRLPPHLDDGKLYHPMWQAAVTPEGEVLYQRLRAPETPTGETDRLFRVLLRILALNHAAAGGSRRRLAAEDFRDLLRHRRLRTWLPGRTSSGGA